MEKELQGDIFGNWTPVKKIYNQEKADKSFYRKLQSEKKKFYKKKGKK